MQLIIYVHSGFKNDAATTPLYCIYIRHKDSRLPIELKTFKQTRHKKLSGWNCFLCLFSSARADTAHTLILRPLLV